MRLPRGIRFFLTLARENRLRVERRRHLGGDALLILANALLRPAGAVLARIWEDPRFPLVFVVGVPRSGTTLLTQLLARHTRVAWVDNRTARFWMAPLLPEVMRRQREPHPELIPLHSNLGATSGVRSPHEFTYFWRWWMGDHEADQLTAAQLDEVPWKTLRRELYGLAGYHRRPLLMKNLNYVDLQVATLAEHLPNVRFLWLQREPVFVVQSILESRRKRYGDESTWWSIRPAGWREWQGRDPVEQVVFQVRELTRRLKEGLSELPAEQWQALRYEELAAAPARVIEDLAAYLGVETRALRHLADLRLDNGNVLRVSPQQAAHIEEVLARD